MDFVAIDVETANESRASICKIGAVKVSGTAIVSEWSTYVDPEDDFDPFNVEIHGITPQKVKDAPKFPEAFAEFLQFSGRAILVSHTAFDRTAIQEAASDYEFALPQLSWLDSARVARRAWPDRYGVRGYGLANIAADLGIEFTHHDALHDAKAAAKIMLSAMQAADLDLESWLQRVELPIWGNQKRDSNYIEQIKKDGNPDGPLYGEVMVFTGALSLPRREAAELAAIVGCRVDSGVTKRTTILVVGGQNERKLSGSDKSSKHRKAEALIVNKSQPIRIVTEEDFISLIRTNGVELPELKKTSATARKKRRGSSLAVELSASFDEDTGELVVRVGDHEQREKLSDILKDI